MSATGFAAIFLVGLLGGTHCVGMCGGIVGALAAQSGGNRAAWPLHLAYNVGRILSYTAAGALVGSIGGLGLAFGPVATVQLSFYVVANLMLVALGFYLMGFTRSLAFAEQAGLSLWNRIRPLTSRFLPVKTVGQALPLGMLWGWLPCGLVYSVLATALVSGSAVRGATAMLVFGLGTLPNLLLAGLLLSRFRRFAQAPVARAISGGLVLGFGIYGLYHAMGMAELIWRGQGAGG
ncbi:MAG TPA: sulfite exporter TauE/SafE family protein [Rhodocyclaceae bacterium]|nr:sulfite exporter TauE/SafE family protein [Rhodocyclaceae bacterium]